MTVLSNFPMVSQLTPISTDGSSPNAQFDCVPACLCAGAMYLNGIHAMNAEYNPDMFLDKAYGEGHKGGTDAQEYVNFLASLSIHLYSVSAASASFLVEDVHGLLAKGLPVIMTILDPYVPASYGWTHAVIAFADSAGEITVLDPYIGKPVTKSDSEWTALLRGELLWILAKAETPGTPEGWSDDGTTLTAPNGIHVVLGFREWVLSHTWNKDDWPLEAEQALPSLEDSNPSIGAGSQQIFRFSMLGYTKERGVFAEWSGQELLYLRARYAALYQWYESWKSAYVAGQVTPPQAMP